MACAKWLHHRIWCGDFPRFQLPSSDEVAREQNMSIACFKTSEFSELRMQIRIKLSETPSIATTRPTGSSEPFADILLLMQQYVPYLIALERSARQSAHFPFELPAPLFQGIDDRHYSTQNLKFDEWIVVEKAFIWLTLAQFHAVRAEWRADRGLQRHDERLLQRAEDEWAKSQRFACLSAAVAAATATSTKVCDTPSASHPTPNGSTIDQILPYVANIAYALGHQCALRQMSAHASRKLLTVEQPELIVRTLSALAHRAVWIAQSAASALANLRLTCEDDLLQQLIVCIEADIVRWTAIFYNCEQNAFHLDASPELALLFVELQLALRLPPMPAHHRRSTSIFDRITQEVQLYHTSHLTQALDDKKELLSYCQQRFGPLWTPPDLEEIKKMALGTLVEQPSSTNLPTWRSLTESTLEDSNLVDTSNLEEVIKKSIEEVGNNIGIGDSGREPRTNQIFSPVNSGDQSNLAEIVSPRVSNTSKVNVQKPGSTYNDERRTLASRPPRPSSAQPAIGVPDTNTKDSQPWVTILHGGKTLHFEKSLPLPTTAGDNSLNNCLEQSNHNGAYRLERLKLMKRPSSSPSYLSPAKIKESPGIAQQQIDQLRATLSSPAVPSRMWTPTRFPCALCEQRFMRCNLPGVAVMKRIFDIRQKWGVVLHDAKKFSAPSALYAKANVCVMCQEILQCQDGSSEADATDGISNSTSSVCEGEIPSTSAEGLAASKCDDIGLLICNAIAHRWSLQHQTNTILGQSVEKLHLVDVALRKRARQSSTVCSMHARNAVQPRSTRCAHTKEERQPWWEVDLANYVVVHSVKIYLRVETSHLYVSPGASSGAGSSSPSRRKRSGVFPLHIAISMKTGVGRDLEDVLASCVSSHKVEERDAASVGAGTMLVEWSAPPNARGRFVRIQSERLALLHIEHVHVFVAQIPISLSSLTGATAKANSEVRRRKLQRAAFRASVIATNVNGGNSTSTSGAASRKGVSRAGQQIGDSLLLSSLLDQPEQAEKKRLSKLYTRFRTLLEQRTQYDATQEGTGSP